MKKMPAFRKQVAQVMEYHMTLTAQGHMRSVITSKTLEFLNE